MIRSWPGSRRHGCPSMSTSASPGCKRIEIVPVPACPGDPGGGAFGGGTLRGGAGGPGGLPIDPRGCTGAFCAIGGGFGGSGRGSAISPGARRSILYVILNVVSGVRYTCCVADL